MWKNVADYSPEMTVYAKCLNINVNNCVFVNFSTKASPQVNRVNLTDDWLIRTADLSRPVRQLNCDLMNKGKDPL